MESHPPLTSPDGSSNKNTPEGCSSPLYSGDYTQKRHKILRCYQNKKLKRFKTEVKEEVEEPSVTGRDPCKEEKIPPQISTDPGDIQRDVKAEKVQKGHVKIEGNAVLEIGMDGQYRLSEENDVPSKKKKPFLCSECGKCYDRKSFLIIHQRSHTGEKPFSCSECGKRFSHNSHLNDHKIQHTEAEPFSCSECGSQFPTWHMLVMHRRIHSSDNVYQCSKCGQAFFKQANLKKHERLHRRLEPC